MLTLNRMLNELCEAGKLQFEGNHYDSNEPVYTGDLWRLFPSGERCESKKQNRLRECMESKGMQLRFYDETISDDDGLVHEQNPGYAGQTLTYKILSDCDVWSERRALENVDDYIAAMLNTEGNQADRWLSDKQLRKAGFKLFNYDAESGFHVGQTDTPESVIAQFEAKLKDSSATYDYLFQITDVGQFDINFRLWTRKQEESI